MINIVSCRPSWAEEFRKIGEQLRAVLGKRALRIDHIGSTSVPGLAAKDIIDVQITVANLDPEIERCLNEAGYQRVVRISQDHIPPTGPEDIDEWTKWVFQPAPDGRPAHIHVRLAGRANQRYPLLFRDYLRSHPAAAEAYARVKVALARLHPDDKEAYYDVKDPVCDIIMEGAEAWAVASGWGQAAADC